MKWNLKDSKQKKYKEEITKAQIEIAADAEAERQRRIADGGAAATLARYNAEAEGQKTSWKQRLLVTSHLFRALAEMQGSRYTTNGRRSKQS